MGSDNPTATAIKDHQQPHFLVLPCPVQGHINPMLQFCKRLKQEGARVTLVATRFCFNNILKKKLPSSIAIDTVSDGFDKGGADEAEGFKAYFETFQKVGTETLSELIEKLASSGNNADCIVYDSFMPWVLEVAKRFGLSSASFLTQSLAISSVYYHLQQKKMDIMKMEIQLPGLPLLQPKKDLSSLVFAHQAHPDLFDVLLAQFENIDEVDWILCNTFYELEKEVADWLKTIWPKLRTVGPTVPSMFPDKSLKEEDEDYGFNLYKNEDCCLKWLDDKPKGSVVYFSFGSMSNIIETQMEELAYGLRDSETFFLWVVRDYEESKLPKDFNKISEKGLVVSWCPQLKVLSHEAIGCFFTHSGWNSTLEALCMGVPMVALPQWTDQSMNAKNVTDVWKMGIRADESGEKDDDGIVKRETLKKCIKKVMTMESERGKEMKKNAIPWKVSASEAIDEGGSSQKNIREFVESHRHQHKFIMEMDKTTESSCYK